MESRRINKGAGTRQSQTTNARDSWDSKKIMTACVLVFAAIAAIAVPGYFIYRSYATYNANVIEKTFERQATKPAPKVPIDELFGDDQMRAYEEGQGLKVTFKTDFGGDAEQEVFLLEPWATFEQTSIPERKDYVAKRKSEFEQAVKDFESNKPRTLAMKIYVDDTDGISANYKAQVLNAIDELKLVKWLKLGNGLDLEGFRLSSLDATDNKKVSIEQSSGPRADAQANGLMSQVKEVVTFLLVNRGPKSHSSVATALFDSAANTTEYKSQRIIVFSDGLENSDLASVYTNKNLLLDENKWEELDKDLTQVRPFPSLAGSSVEWYVPVTGKDAPLQRASERYWKRVLLQKCGAGQVVTHLVKL